MKNKKNPLYQSVYKRNMNLRMLSSAWTPGYDRMTETDLAAMLYYYVASLDYPLVLQFRVIQ